MGITAQLKFDPTDTESLNASHSVGAYIRAGTDGDLIGSETLNLVEWLRVAGPIIDSAGNEVGVTSNALDVNIAAATGLAIFAEDSAHTTGDDGQHILVVRQDILAASTDANGDYASLKSNSLGELYVKDSDVLAQLTTGVVVTATDLDIRDLTAASDSVESWTHDGAGNAITSTGTALDVNIASGDIDDSLANTSIVNTATAVSTTAINVVGSALANRKWLYLANLGNRMMYFGQSGVTTANGFPMASGEKMEFRIGASVTPQIIGASGSSSEDIRVMELS